MNIIKFDVEKGIYITELENFHSDLHSHPAAEIIFAETGTFELLVNNTTYKELTFAIVKSNVPHKVSFVNCKAHILIVEHRDRLLKTLFAKKDIAISDGLFTSTGHFKKSILENLLLAIHQNGAPNEYDSRVQKVVDFLKKNSISYFELKTKVRKLVPLSDSRLRHLFKENLGVSLKKYLVWCNLRNTIHNHINEKEELMESFLFNGFYDQPHFNKSYKSFIGTSPARTYK